MAALCNVDCFSKTKVLQAIYDQWSMEEIIWMDLHTAASIGCEEKVKEIIENSENRNVINSQNKDGWTPLMYAAYSGDPRIVLHLLEEGADARSKNFKGHTPLILATKCGNTDSATFLIENGADVDARDFQGWTALFYAASSGHRSVVQLLIEKGCNVNIFDEKQGFTPLMVAAAAGHEMIIKDLLQNGASLSVSSKCRQTARSLAIQNGHIKVKNTIDAYLFHKQSYLSAKPKTQNLLSSSLNLFGLLEALGLSKYYHIFERQEIDLGTFLTLSDKDLKDIGIELIGPRRKITSAIARWHQNRPLTGSVEEQAFANKLLEECKELSQHLSELSVQLTQEQNMRMVMEQHLAEDKQMLRNFSEKVQRIASHLKDMEEHLKNAHGSLKELCVNLKNPNSRGNWCWLKSGPDLPTTATVFDIVNFMDDLIDKIYKETVLLVQNTSFQS